MQNEIHDSKAALDKIYLIRKKMNAENERIESEGEKAKQNLTGIEERIKDQLEAETLREIRMNDLTDYINRCLTVKSKLQSKSKNLLEEIELKKSHKNDFQNAIVEHKEELEIEASKLEKIRGEIEEQKLKFKEDADNLALEHQALIQQAHDTAHGIKKNAVQEARILRNEMEIEVTQETERMRKDAEEHLKSAEAKKTAIEAEAEEFRLTFEDQKANLLESSKQQASEIIAEAEQYRELARTEREQATETARQEASEIIAEAENDRELARQEREQATETARQEASDIITEAHNDRELARQEREQATETAKQEASEIIAEAEKYKELVNSEKEHIIDAANQEAKDIVSAAENLKESINADRAAIIDTAKEEAQEIVAESEKIKESVGADRNAIIESAKEEAQEIVAESEKIKESVGAEKAQLIEAAQQEAEGIVEESKKVKEKAEKNAERYKRLQMIEAEKEREGLVVGARNKAEQITGEAQKKAEEIQQQAQQQIANKQKSANEEFEAQRKQELQIRAKMQKDAKALLENANKEANNLKDQSQKKYEDDKKAQKEKLAIFKLQEIERVEADCKTMQRKYKNRRKDEIREVLKQVELKLRKQISIVQSSSKEEPANALIDNVSQIIDTVMNYDEKAKFKTEINEVLIADKSIIKKNKLFYMKLAFGIAGLATLVAAYDVAAPYLSNMIKDEKNNKNTVSELYTKKVKESKDKKRKKAKFDPDKTAEFKDTFVDNVLYTSRYVEFETDSRIHKKWIVGLNKYFEDKLDLQENDVVQIVVLEKALVKKIERAAEKLRNDTVESAIIGLRGMEVDFKDKAIKILKTEANYFAYFKFKRTFYEKQAKDF
ncbi:MAG: hypothetical protein AB8G05_27890 [Oligoflexales bacterium]